jgi:hypothetical protein
METIELDDRFTDFVDQEVLPQFSTRRLQVTSPARNLIAFAMQSQIAEEVTNEERLFTRARQLLSENLADAYVRKYGEGTVTFNQAFHLLHDVGYVMKFPLAPTNPFS